MSCKRNLQATVNWTLPFVNYQPLTIGALDPALTIANLVMQTMLGPPFTWRFNRAEVTITLDTTNQDYTVSTDDDDDEHLSDFGFIEKVWLANTGRNRDLKEIEVKSVLAKSAEVQRPAYICALRETADNAMTFRFNTIPTEEMTATIMYQKKPPIFTSLANKWRPIPDEYAFIYDRGFQALACTLVNDSRFPIFNQQFVSHLLAAQDGLDELQRNIFLGNWDVVTKQIQRATQQAQQGTAARQL